MIIKGGTDSFVNPIKKSISVIMSVYDTPFLGAAVDSILKQTFADFEFIIVVDNPHNKELCDLVNGYVDCDKRIKVIFNKENIGLAGSLNRGINESQGVYIARMDSDDISLPRRLEVQKEFLDNNPTVGLVGTCAMRIDEKGEEQGNMLLPADPILLSKMLAYTTAAYHPTWMFRREIISRVGLYRAFPVAQDYDFLYRCVDAGVEISNIQEVLFKYRIASHNASVKKFLDQWNIRKYIQRLQRERVKTGVDSFSDDEVIKVLKVSDFRRKMCGVSQAFFEKGVVAKRHRKWLVFILCVTASLVVYPARLEVLYSTLRSKLLTRYI